MADRTMIYDFETALKALLDSNSDLIGILTLWDAMLDSKPRYVDFPLHDGTVLHTPNIQMIVDTINERALPPNPTFQSVTVSGGSGNGHMASGGVSFEGAAQRGTYDANGVEGEAWHVKADDPDYTAWPPNRYWVADASAATTVTMHPRISRGASYAATDFFVFVPATSAGITIILPGPTYEARQRIRLACPAGKNHATWHVCIFANYPEQGYSQAYGSAKLMDEG